MVFNLVGYLTLIDTGQEDNFKQMVKDDVDQRTGKEINEDDLAEPIISMYKRVKEEEEDREALIREEEKEEKQQQKPNNNKKNKKNKNKKNKKNKNNKNKNKD